MDFSDLNVQPWSIYKKLLLLTRLTSSTLHRQNCDYCGFRFNSPCWRCIISPSGGYVFTLKRKHFTTQDFLYLYGPGRVSQHGRILTRPSLWYHSYVLPEADQQQINGGLKGDIYFVWAFTSEWALFQFTARIYQRLNKLCTWSHRTLSHEITAFVKIHAIWSCTLSN